MGNSPSTASSSTTITNGEQYDVFISFRGEDTRNGFTSHLYHALDEKQIKTFIDNQLVRGEEISEGLLSVIRESKISVIIFSENYAFSKWCLRELEEIMKYREMNNQIIIPVFYQVDPSHVRKQIGSYEAAFAKHENELQQDDVNKWRRALTEASNISGFDFSKARNESEFVCDIVRDVWNKLNNIWPSCDFKDLVKGLVGIEKPIERVVSLLCLGVPDFRIIGIWGMGGMGKTTIADAVFHLVSNQFEKAYFAPCVRVESEKDSSGLIRLRNEILSELLNEGKLKIGSHSIPLSIKRRINQKKILIVLDDVDKLTKLEILAGGLDRFGPGSRIILTTRDKQVLCNWGGDDHNMYKVKGLNHDEALQLFCNYAFKQNHPTEDLEVLSREVVKIAKDVPLVVKVLGSSMYKKSKRDWENAVHKFQRIFNPDVLDVLKISYDGLDEEEKGLFLDLACFDEPRIEGDFATNLISNREFSLRGLIDKSLVTVDHLGSYKMHDLLREMGREIVDKESPNKPGDRSRLWRQEDILHILKHNDGITNAVQGILLNLYHIEDKCLISQAIEKMYNLRTLIIKGPYTIGGLDYLPDELRYLHWNYYPLEVLPSSFNPANLVELDLSYSNIIKQLWKERTCVPKLKRLKLYGCCNLIRIPDLSDIPLVESIDLGSCISLLEIHSSRECPKLKWLNLYGCKNLISIPDLSDIPSAESINLERCISLLEISSSRECPKNLRSLKLSLCENLSTLPSNIHIEGVEFSLLCCISLTKFPYILGNIKSLDLSGSGVEEVPSTIQSLSKLESLLLEGCTGLKRISKSICKLKSLDELYLSECCKLESFPVILEGMEPNYPNLSETAIKELPPPIGNLNRLEELVLSDCKNLETFPSSISNFNLYGCSKLEKLHPLSGLRKLGLNDCNLTEISEDIGCLSSLERLELDVNVFERLPKSIKKLSKLYHLSLSSCGMLRSLPELPSSLRHLEARNCKQLIQSLPDSSLGGGSLYFNFINCLKMNQKAVSNLLIFFRDSLLKMQLMGTEKIISLFERDEQKELKGSICLPGSEIPEWFCYKNIGSSINIRELRNDCGRSSYIIGFVVCLVIGFEDSDSDLCGENLHVDYGIHIETSDGRKERISGDQFLRFRMPIEDNGFIDSDHILLACILSSQCYKLFHKLDALLANHGLSYYVGTSIVFNIQPLLRCAFNKTREVKYCGIQPIYSQAQVMNSLAINQDTEDTCGSDDTEETCEPHPKRICTEANQSS